MTNRMPVLTFVGSAVEQVEASRNAHHGLTLAAYVDFQKANMVVPLRKALCSAS